MLSHRVAMFMALHAAATENGSDLNASAAALDKFEEITCMLRNGAPSQGIEPALCDRLSEDAAVRSAIDAASEFLERARIVMSPVKPKDLHAVQGLATFVAGDLLAELNSLNDAIRRILADEATARESREHARRAAFADGIQTKISNINSKIKIVSVNALIEAARAGEHGKAFRIVAGEITSLSDLSNRVLDEFASEHRGR